MNLHQLIKGDRNYPPVLCIHGLLGSSRNLFRLVDGLGAGGFLAMAYDQRGHGRSPHMPSGESYTLDLLARDAAAVLDAHHIERAHVLGHSLGARVALAFAGMWPDRLLSLTILDASPRMTGQSVNEVDDILAGLAESYLNRAAAEAAFAHQPKPLQQFLLSNLRAQSDGSLQWVFDLNGIRRSLTAGLRVDQTNIWKGLRCPTLLVRGADSTFLTAPEMEALLAQQPHATGVTISNAGHWVHADQPMDTAKAVLDFLNRLLGATGASVALSFVTWVVTLSAILPATLGATTLAAAATTQAVAAPAQAATDWIQLKWTHRGATHTLVVTPKSGYHFNKDAPSKCGPAPSDQKSQYTRPTRLTENHITFIDPPQTCQELIAYVCDDARTICQRVTISVSRKE